MNSDELRGLVAKATPTPWRASAFGNAGDQEPTSFVVHAGPFDWDAIRHGEADVAAWCDYDSFDAELIVAAVNELVPLLDRAEAAEAERDALAAKVARIEALYRGDHDNNPHAYCIRGKHLATALAGDL